MNNITRLRKADYEEAISLANNGETDAALDILWELRLKVDLSIYRRALVNVTLASLLARADRDKYAQECLDLLDLFRQQHADDKDIDEELEHISDIEDAAREIMKYNPWLKNESTPHIQQDSNTGLLSEADAPQHSPTKEVSGDMENLSLLPSAFGSNSHSSADQDTGEIVWESDYTPLESIPSNLPRIEGFLRDQCYAPLGSTPVPANQPLVEVPRDENFTSSTQASSTLKPEPAQGLKTRGGLEVSTSSPTPSPYEQPRKG